MLLTWASASEPHQYLLALPLARDSPLKDPPVLVFELQELLPTLHQLGVDLNCLALANNSAQGRALHVRLRPDTDVGHCPVPIHRQRGCLLTGPRRLENLIVYLLVHQILHPALPLQLGCVRAPPGPIFLRARRCTGRRLPPPLLLHLCRLPLGGGAGPAAHVARGRRGSPAGGPRPTVGLEVLEVPVARHVVRVEHGVGLPDLLQPRPVILHDVWVVLFDLPSERCLQRAPRGAHGHPEQARGLAGRDPHRRGPRGERWARQAGERRERQRQQHPRQTRGGRGPRAGSPHAGRRHRGVLGGSERS
mmetsp:Transcript_17792/g.47592  ORF Transcript_17792/g.47592 Transcript_17792/m.47592 type:complete len:306 (+) Transcript_17792:314-1231(+)